MRRDSFLVVAVGDARVASCVGCLPPRQRRCHYHPIYICHQNGVGGHCWLACGPRGFVRWPCSARRSDPRGPDQRAFAHLFVRANELAPANRPVKPAVARGPLESAQAPDVAAVPNTAGDDLLVANIKTAAMTKTRTRVAASVRPKAYAMHVTAKHSKSVRRYAAKKSHRQVVATDWRYGGYSSGRYGLNSYNRYGSWFFN